LDLQASAFILTYPSLKEEFKKLSLCLYPTINEDMLKFLNAEKHLLVLSPRPPSMLKKKFQKVKSKTSMPI
jgi:hypothetical protein